MANYLFRIPLLIANVVTASYMQWAYFRYTGSRGEILAIGLLIGVNAIYIIVHSFSGGSRIARLFDLWISSKEHELKRRIQPQGTSDNHPS